MQAKKEAAGQTRSGTTSSPEPGKDLPVLPIIGGIVLVVLLVGFFALNSMNSLGDADTGVPALGIDVLEAPVTAAVGDTITVVWRVVGTTAESSELVYSSTPKGAFGADADVSGLTVDASGYEGRSAGQPASSEFSGSAFTASITVDYVPLFIRMHAVSGSNNYWTGELVVMPE